MMGKLENKIRKAGQVSQIFQLVKVKLLQRIIQAS